MDPFYGPEFHGPPNFTSPKKRKLTIIRWNSKKKMSVEKNEFRATVIILIDKY